MFISSTHINYKPVKHQKQQVSVKSTNVLIQSIIKKLFLL